jgi:DNA-binding MarR family transcriptional regulator
MNRRLFFNLVMAARNVHRQATNALPNGIGLTQSSVLLALSEGKSMSVGEVAHSIGASRPATSELAVRMERAGLIDRLEDPSDGRGCLLRITTSGLAIRQSVKMGVAKFERNIAGELTEEQLNIVAAWLKSLQNPK